MAFKLLLVSAAYPPFKAPESAHAQLLCERLAQRGVEVHLLTARHESGNVPQPAGVTVHPLYPDWNWRRLPGILQFIRSLRPDAILLNYIDWVYACQPMVTFLPGFVRRYCGGIRFVTQLTNENGLSSIKYPATFRNRVFRRVAETAIGPGKLDPSYGSIFRDSTKMIALSEIHLDAFERAHPGVSGKAMVVPVPPIIRIVAEDAAWSARARGRAKLGLSEGEVAIVYFGNIYYLKDLETLLLAFGKVASRARLIVIGEGEAPHMEELRKISRGTGAGDRVSWLGYCDDETASLYLRAADFCVLPFVTGVRLNNSSCAVALTHGLPVVATRGEVMEEAFQDGKNILLYKHRDVEGLARVMNELAGDPQLRQRLGAAASVLAAEHFSWDFALSATLEAAGCRQGIAAAQQEKIY